jgi:hypothetical protein
MVGEPIALEFGLAEEIAPDFYFAPKGINTKRTKCQQYIDNVNAESDPALPRK